MNGTHGILAYADDENWIGRTIQRNIDVLLNACKGICLQHTQEKLITWEEDVIEALWQMSFQILGLFID